MSLERIFQSAAQRREKDELPVLRQLIERYSDETPFSGQTVVFGHILVRNALVMFEALWRGGARVVLCDAHPSPAEAEARADLRDGGVTVYPLNEAVRQGDLFLDVGAVLGRLRTPAAAAEVTRTGVMHYERIPCPVISADDCRTKYIEGFFGTGEAFLRAWQKFRPRAALDGKRLVQFGYGKIGRGVAHQTRRAGMRVTVVEVDAEARSQAEADGFPALSGAPEGALRQILARADVVISVTGVPAVLSRSVPPEWIRANRPALVNLGAEDEFGPAFADREILGGRSVPLNFHLSQPTLNRYVDPVLAAHLLALEALMPDPGSHPVGVHPLPAAMDRWALQAWRTAWPEEDLSGIGETLGLD